MRRRLKVQGQRSDMRSHRQDYMSTAPYHTDVILALAEVTHKGDRLHTYLQQEIKRKLHLFAK